MCSCYVLIYLIHNFYYHILIASCNLSFDLRKLLGKYFSFLCEKIPRPMKDPHLKRADFDKILSELDEPICPNCKRIFSSRGNLRRHMEIHIMSDRKRFQCDICLKKYKRKDYLKEHKMTVHSPSNKWKFLRVCKEDYYKEISLNMH
ncbi:hypothetical protein TNIN_132741 [Trichonephila inaurata madagascariensis]|uniref:C2H2-type domain-containing protein n=1 Tax=Trichonephila inaurata madagascariensis TaxID=2747483 RepID=A0A8X6YL84_9ARAC|nr:hypothetical protein TNIN_132741 [Trichonephila inaurata madagascariensis]